MGKGDIIFILHLQKLKKKEGFIMEENKLQGIIIKEHDTIHVDLEKDKMFATINTDIKFKKVEDPLKGAITLLDDEAVMIKPFKNNIVTIVKESKVGLEQNTLLMGCNRTIVEAGRVIFANCDDGTKGEITGLSAEQVEYLMTIYSVGGDFNTFTDGLYE